MDKLDCHSDNPMNQITEYEYCYATKGTKIRNCSSSIHCGNCENQTNERQQLIDAARMLRQYCRDRGDCTTSMCPFYNKEAVECLFENYPRRYYISELTESQEIIRAAKMLKQHCKDSGDCKFDNCHFYNEKVGQCCLKDYPYRWKNEQIGE